MSTKPTEIAQAVRGVTEQAARAQQGQSDDEIRKAIAAQRGITGNRAAMQRSLTGQAPADETERERKARLIARGTARLMQMGLNRKQSEKVARRSYSLAKQDAKA